MPRALLMVNPHSRHGQADLAEVEGVLRGGFRLQVATPRGAQAMRAAVLDQARGLDLVIVGGGDGSLNCTLPALLSTGLPLAVLPLGTANDLARTLNIPDDPVAAARLILQGTPRPVDVGLVNGHPFLNVASLGLSVRVARGLTTHLKRRYGLVGYGLQVLRALREARPFMADILAHGRHQRLRVIQIAVGNGRHYGGGMTVAEQARIDDARLDLYAIEPMSVVRLAALLPALRQGRQAERDGVLALRDTAFDIHTDRRLAVNTDGEVTTCTPARFRLLPRALRVMTPDAA